MDARMLLNLTEELLEEAKAGLLTTVDEGGNPRVRWMTPARLKWRPGAIYCFTRPDSAKIRHLEQHPGVEWLIQNKSLTKLVTLRGTVNIVDNPALKNEVLDTLGGRLEMFWKADLKRTEFVVLETELEEGIYYEPMKGRQERVNLKGGG